ncbi:MAG: penicillin-binding protein activator LpoB [Treponema sp.]|jgi:hypothetical protein|nr:penicillin-binding protein activator LpoB [Treponema sp.]
MKKVIAWIFLWVPAVFGFTQQQVIPLDDAIRDSVNYLIEQLPLDSRVRIDFTQAHKKEISDYIVGKMVSTVITSGRVTVVDRDMDHLEIAYEEQDRHDQGYAQEGTAPETGQELGAQVTISGSIDPMYGDLYQMKIQAVNLTTREIHGHRAAVVRLNSFLVNLLGLKEIRPSRSSFSISIENHFYRGIFSDFTSLERDIRKMINESITRSGYTEVNGSVSTADYAVTIEFTNFKLQKPKRGFYVSGNIGIRVIHTNDHSVLFELYEPYKGSAQPTESRAFTVLCELIRYDIGSKFNTALSEHILSMR